MTDHPADDGPALEDFPARSHDKLRYGDTDRQGHVNNAVFSTLLETGRVELLHPPDGGLDEPGASWVIARLELDFLGEVRWPGRVDIGTRVQRVGRSSVTLGQALFQDGRAVARAVTVIVQVDDASHGSRPLSDTATARFGEMAVSPG